MFSSLKFAFTATLLFATAAQAQQRPPADTTRPQKLDALIITAERTLLPLNASTGSVTRLTRAELQGRPLRNFAEALQQAPGITFVDFEGSGNDPQMITRGFYGGGEAEYVLVMLDGRPINSLENGRVNWDLIPLNAIESVEIVRGPGSALWGDAAMGGVINVITRGAAPVSFSTSVVAGENGVRRGSGRLAFGSDANAIVSYLKSDGFREHAERESKTVNALIGLKPTLQLAIDVDRRDYQEPGPLTGQELTASREASSPFYRFDRSDEQWYRVALQNNSPTGGRRQWRAAVTGELRDLDRIRTLRLSPGFADTKERDLLTTRALGSAEYRIGDLLRGGDLLVGVDASYGRVSSEYYDVLMGPEQAYSAGVGQRGALSAETSGNRTTAAAFGRFALPVTNALQLTFGARADWLKDSFDDVAGAPTDADHLVFNPRIGANFRYANSAQHEGRIYVTHAGTFKAPTPDQLYDRRLIPVPFEPFQISFSNASLKPQEGRNWEAGLYHRVAMVPNRWSFDVTAAAYQLDLENEIDFDINTFGYNNIGESQHRGLELGANLNAPQNITLFGNYTMQAATRVGGEADGKYLKAIPRHVIAGGISAGPATGLNAAVTGTNTRQIFLDDANTIELPNFTRWDARVGYTFGRYKVFADVFNLLDSEYSTTGFPDADPTSGVVYYHPAAGRTLQIGLSLR